MSLIAFVLTLAVVGVLLMLLNKYGGEWIDGTVLRIINVVVIIVVILWCLRVLGLLSYIPDIRVGPR